MHRAARASSPCRLGRVPLKTQRHHFGLIHFTIHYAGYVHHKRGLFFFDFYLDKIFITGYSWVATGYFHFLRGFYHFTFYDIAVFYEGLYVCRRRQLIYLLVADHIG